MKLTHKQIDAAIERIEAAPLKARSHIIAKLAEEMKVSTSTLRWHCVRAGVRCSAAALKPPAPDTSPRVIMRNGHALRRFTAEEDAKIIALDAEGLGPSAIGKALGRNCNTIIGRLATLARYQEAS